MANGVSTSLGYSIPQVGGMFPLSEYYDSVSGRNTSLMYELGLSSISPKFYKGKFVSPLDVANAPLYSRFGLKKQKNDCKKFVKNKSINPSTGRPIKSGGAKYKQLNKDCKKGKTITKRMCEKFLESGKKINPLTGKAIKKDGPTYKLLMKKCKVKDLPLKKMESKPLRVSATLDKKTVPKNLDYLDLSVFTSKKPSVPVSPLISRRPSLSIKPPIKYPGNPGTQIYPVWVQPPPSTNTYNGIKYIIQPRKFISFNGKELKVGSKAKIDSTGTQSTITNIGLKQITLRKDLTSKENRLTIESFLSFNN
jgi:hypothetical protein